MLAQTMNKFRRNKSTTPLKYNPNNINIVNSNKYQYQSRNNLHTAYQPNASIINPQLTQTLTSFPQRVSFPYRDIEIMNGSQKLNYFQPINVDLNSATLQGNLIKTKSQIINIPPLRQFNIQQSPEKRHQQQLLHSERKIISIFQIDDNEILQPTIHSQNKIQKLHYQRQIDNLKQQLSQAFSDKLSIQLKLNKAIESNKNFQKKILSLTKTLQSSPNTDPNKIHSQYHNRQNDTIVQLLKQSQDTKKIIQKLMQDNQQLLKKNEQLKTFERKTFKLNQQLQKFKIIVIKTQNDKISLQKQIDDLLRKQNNNNQKPKEFQDLTVTNQEQVLKLNQQIQALKNHIIKMNNQKILQQHNSKNDSEKAFQMRKQIQQYIIIMSSKDQQIIILKQQLSQMGMKLKQVLSQLMSFSQAFQVQKMQLVNQFQIYKQSSTEQIHQLKKKINGYERISASHQIEKQIKI